MRAEQGIKTPDAIHLATALLAGCNIVVTNDSAWRKVRRAMIVAVLDDYL
jgi:predicted nucleic acid-binding protein